jgi:hypothetical protein
MSLHYAPTSERDRAAQRGLERHVFALLRRARKPRVLESLPLMKSVCRETGSANPVAALERIVRSALEDAASPAMRQAILAADFDRVANNGELARRLGISRRHFQRLRAKAVAKIAARMRPIAEASFSSNDWRYDCEDVAYRRAQAAGHALEMRSIARNMVRLAETKEGRALAHARRADADLRLGRVDDALQGMGRLSPSAQRMIRAKLAFLRGDFARAQTHAAAAGGAMQSSQRERYEYLAFVAQIRFERSRRWAPPDVCSLPADSWERTLIDAEHARHLWRGCERGRSEELARSAYERAAAHGYQGVAARCAAVLAGAARRRHAGEASKRWRAAAIEHLLRTQDCLAAASLFTHDGCWAAGDADDELLDVIYDRLLLVTLRARHDDRLQRAAVRTLIRGVLEATLAGRPAIVDERLAPPKHFAAVRDVFALTIAALGRRPLPAACESIRAAESQRVPTEHLRIDDERSAPRTRSVESLADLRLWLVPV